MLKIRMQRIGRRHDPHFRIVVIDSRQGPKSGKFVEMLGSYDAKLGNVQIKNDRAEYWLSQGAQPTGTVHNFLVDQGVIKGDKLNVLPQKTPVVSDTPAEAPATSAPKEEAPVADAENAVVEETAQEPEEETKKEEEPAPAAEQSETPAEETPEVVAEEAPTEDQPAEEEKTA